MVTHFNELVTIFIVVEGALIVIFGVVIITTSTHRQDLIMDSFTLVARGILFFTHSQTPEVEHAVELVCILLELLMNGQRVAQVSIVILEFPAFIIVRVN